MQKQKSATMQKRKIRLSSNTVASLSSHATRASASGPQSKLMYPAVRVSALGFSEAEVVLVTHASVDGIVHLLPNMGACERQFQLTDTQLVLIKVPGAAYEDRLAEYTTLVERFPSIQWVAVFDDHKSDLSALARLGKAGVADAIRQVVLSSGDALQRLVVKADRKAITERIMARIGNDLDEALETLLRTAVSLAHAPITVPQLATARRLHERSLRKWCEQQAIASPQWIVGWARCLVVAHYLDDKGRSIQNVAKLLGFSSVGAITNHLRRYTGQTGTALRAEGALDSVIIAMRANRESKPLNQLPCTLSTTSRQSDD